MSVLFAIILNFLPFILCLAFFRYYLRADYSTGLSASLWGLAAVLPITFIQFFLMSLMPDKLAAGCTDMTGLFCKFLVMNGLLEEGIKAFFIKFIPYKKLDLKTFFTAAVLSGLCLGCFESMIYFLQHLVNAKAANRELLYGMIFLRMFSSDIIHGLCAGLCGLFVWSVRTRHTDFLCIIFAVFIHGIFDFFVYLPVWVHWFAVAAILFGLMECRVRFLMLSEALEMELTAGTVNPEPQLASETEKKSGTKRRTAKAKGKSTSKKQDDTSADKTVVTSSAKVSKSKAAGRTKTRARKPKVVEEEIIAEPEVTQEFNDDL